MSQDKNKNSLAQDNLDEFDLGLDNLDGFYDPSGSQGQTVSDEDDGPEPDKNNELDNQSQADKEETVKEPLGPDSQLPARQDDVLDPKTDILEQSLETKDFKADDLSVEKSKQEKPAEEKSLVLPMSKVKIIKKLLANIRENSRQLESLLAGLDVQDEYLIRVSQLETESADEPVVSGRERIIEGVFDGEHMIGPDGKQYTVPANYASKSKLVEGDMMKLTITSNGTFLYKQIGPIERKRLVGTLDKDANGNYIAVVDGKKWRVLTASVTYFRGEVGDEVVILVPKTGVSRWAAVENIVKKS